MIIIDDIDQGSPEWHEMKLGIISSSNFGRVITPTGKRANTQYLTELAIERITGKPYSNYVSYDMLRGTELQPQATRAYEFVEGVQVREVAFCWLDDTKTIGSSTDGLVGDDGVLEIKCPKGTTHVKYLLENKLPS